MKTDPLITEQNKLIRRNKELAAKILKMYQPIDKMKTEIFQNTQAINRLHRQIQSST